MITLSEDEHIELFEVRTEQKFRKIETEMSLIEMELDEKLRMRNSMYPIKIAV